MKKQEVSEWEASWIWCGGEESPRNQWSCFRRSFTPAASPTHATIRITADSRYVLFAAGKLIGRGPVRSWPHELAFDEYEISHLLQPGVETSIAVLVMHYGVSTFQYLRGRGGLLLQVDGVHDTSGFKIVSDASWRTTAYRGYDSCSSRISCQLGFTEIVDAREWDGSWTDPRYDDANWDPAEVIGPAGMQPWTSIVKRPIPYLTEEPVYPSRIDALSAVKPAAWSAVVDVRAVMAPESAEHANPVQFCGYLSTVINLKEAGTLTVRIVDSGRLPTKLFINGRPWETECVPEEYPELYASIGLEAGEHLLFIDITGLSHGHGFHIGFDAGTSRFSVRAPGSYGLEGSPFIAVGPFDQVEHIDHRAVRTMADSHPDYERIRTIASEDDLQIYSSWIRPVDPQLMNFQDIFTSCVWRTAEQAYPVPTSLQCAVTASPDPAVIPIYDGMDCELVIDFGRELSGYISFEIDAASGTVIDGYGFEFMKDGWRQHTYLLDNTFRYTCSEGRQSYVSFIRRGFRYIAITVRAAARPVKLYEVKLLQSSYPVAEVGRFRSSDPLLGDIWKISRDTTRLCMEDTFVDCPAYEQTYWVGDARNEALVNYYTFGAKEIVEHCLKLVPGSAFQSPLYADQVPSGWSSVIPNWTFFWINACHEYYMYDGKLSFLQSIWPHIGYTLEHYLALINKQGLLEFQGWNLLDWAPFEQPRSGVVTPQNMFLVKALRKAAEIGTLAGDSMQADILLKAADRLRAAIDEWLWDEGRHAYLDCIHADGTPSSTTSMQTQVVAYLCDIAAGERKEQIERYIVEPPVEFVQVGSPFMSFFLYEALAKLGRLDILMADMRKNYGFMLENDATSCWEMYPWSGYNQNPKVLTRSHCHAWSAGPAYFLGAYVLGVQGIAPGWTQVRISPQPCGLQWASGSIPLPHEGRIDVSWRDTGDRHIQLHIVAPKQIQIVAEAPEGYNMTVEYRYI